MITFLLRWFKGLIIGWLMSLVFFLVRRALTKTFGNLDAQMRAHHPRSDTTPQEPRHPPANDYAAPADVPADVIETIWIGMTAEHLRATFGIPQTTTATATGEIWIYANMNGQGTQTIITLCQGRIEKWQDVRNTLPSIENSQNRD